MSHTTPTLAILAALLAANVPTASSAAQEYMQGDEVFVLRATELRVPGKAVAAVRKGDKLTVEQVQDKWLWVRSGEVRGWIDNRSVIPATLKARYDSQTDVSSVWGAIVGGDKYVDADKSGRATPKLFGVGLDVRGLKPGEGPQICNVVLGGWDNGRRLPKQGSLRYDDIDIALTESGADDWSLSIDGKPYGTVTAGDYVLIAVPARQVFVNGQIRRRR